jgi:hypothetical protein
LLAKKHGVHGDARRGLGAEGDPGLTGDLVDTDLPGLRLEEVDLRTGDLKGVGGVALALFGPDVDADRPRSRDREGKVERVLLERRRRD